MKRIVIVLLSLICHLNATRNLDSNYGTHMTCLLTAAMHTTGPILELGSGDFSTPLLHALCSKDKRYLCSVDTDINWLSLFIDLANDWHVFEHVNAYDGYRSSSAKLVTWDMIGTDRHWAVVFIDHNPLERRVQDIIRLRDNVDVFVVHDTEDSYYQYEPTLSSFKYRYVDKRYNVHATVVSDVIDVTKFFE